MSISGGFVFLFAIPALLVYLCGFFYLINVGDRQAEKAIKAISNKYELLGIMREASKIYHDKKKAKKEQTK